MGSSICSTTIWVCTTGIYLVVYAPWYIRTGICMVYIGRYIPWYVHHYHIPLWVWVGLPITGCTAFCVAISIVPCTTRRITGTVCFTHIGHVKRKMGVELQG